MLGLHFSTLFTRLFTSGKFCQREDLTTTELVSDYRTDTGLSVAPNPTCTSPGLLQSVSIT